MKISQAYPSKYLSVPDLDGGRFTVTIANVVMEDVSGDGTETKPVAYFHGGKKGMVVNKTNAMNLTILFGDETNNWRGQQVEVYIADTTYMGKPTKGLRVGAPPPTAVTPVPPAAVIGNPNMKPIGAAAPTMASPSLPDGRPTAPPVSSQGGPLEEDEIPW